MKDVLKDKMQGHVRSILEIVKQAIANDLARDVNIGLCLKAYNYWRSEERSGIGYIFNIEEDNDLRFLVDNDMITASEISFVMKQDTHLFMFDEKADNGMKFFSHEDLISTLFNNADDYMACAIMYVGRCGKDSPYANIYEEYITSNIEEEFY